MISVSNGPSDRDYAVTNRPAPTRAFGRFRFNRPVQSGTHHEGQTIKICNEFVSNGPCDQDYAFTNGPLCHLPFRLPFAVDFLREGGRGRNNNLTP